MKEVAELKRIASKQVEHTDAHASAVEAEWLPTRKSLLSRLKSWRDQESWNEFFSTYWKLIYATARKAGLTDAEAQDVVQETVVSVCKSMPAFHYDQAGSFKAWLLQLVRWRIKDQLRRRLPPKAEDPAEREKDRTDLLGRLPDPAAEMRLETLWEAEWNNNLLDAALERVKRRVDSKQFQLFELYVIQQWPVARICTLVKTNRGRIYLAKHRISALVKKELRYLKQKYV